ncbi:hypothetical protein FCM35_KLT21182 [Carex littledalei]|uniref:Uncharacterized protein n=1 Tax=Carex littledalei TaxID=544730 RepID=A0A833R7G7_9POAL|nr:hypothetical protein FCM35_KLT21182 [Carex littledalei]
MDWLKLTRTNPDAAGLFLRAWLKTVSKMLERLDYQFWFITRIKNYVVPSSKLFRTKLIMLEINLTKELIDPNNTLAVNLPSQQKYVILQGPTKKLLQYGVHVSTAYSAFQMEALAVLKGIKAVMALGISGCLLHRLKNLGTNLSSTVSPLAD